MRRGFFLGRFQPFHVGHLYVIKDALTKVDELIIGVGSSQEKHTADNPFSVEERIHMIEDSLIAENIKNCKIYPVPDIGEHGKYVEHVATLVPDFEIVFTGSDFTEKLFKEKGYAIEHVTFVDGITGSEIRKRIKHKGDWQELVPKAVVEYLEEINGVERMNKV